MHSTVFKDYSQKKCSLESKIFGAVQVTWPGKATLFKLHKTDLISDLADLYRFLMINAHAICMDKIFGTIFFVWDKIDLAWDKICFVCADGKGIRLGITNMNIAFLNTAHT